MNRPVRVAIVVVAFLSAASAGARPFVELCGPNPASQLSRHGLEVRARACSRSGTDFDI